MKIVVGYALKVYDEKFRNDLEIVRQIRNAFAHSKKLIDFDHELVVAEMEGVQSLPRKKRLRLDFRPQKTTCMMAFQVVCIHLIGQMLLRQTRAITAKHRRMSKKAGSNVNVNRSLIAALIAKPATPPHNDPRDDPAHPARQGLLGGLYALGDYSGKKDK
jgi:hypothetical protein